MIATKSAGPPDAAERTTKYPSASRARRASRSAAAPTLALLIPTPGQGQPGAAPPRWFPHPQEAAPSASSESSPPHRQSSRPDGSLCACPCGAECSHDSSHLACESLTLPAEPSRLAPDREIGRAG